MYISLGLGSGCVRNTLPVTGSERDGQWVSCRSFAIASTQGRSFQTLRTVPRDFSYGIFVIRLRGKLHLGRPKGCLRLFIVLVGLWPADFRSTPLESPGETFQFKSAVLGAG